MVRTDAEICADLASELEMIVLRQEQTRVIVLDQTDLLRLQNGPLSIPDGSVMFALSPDLPWTAAQFKTAEANGALTTPKILSILATSIAKPEAT